MNQTGWGTALVGLAIAAGSAGLILLGVLLDAHR